MAPSATQTQPLASRRRASSASSSFWVAQGSAISQARPQGRRPSRNCRKTAPPSRGCAAAHVLQLHQVFPLLVGEPRLGIQGAFGIGQRDHLAAHFHDLARRVLGDVARAGDRHPLAVEAAATILEHFLGEVDAAEAGRLRADQAAAVAQALAGQHRGELVGQALVLAEQVADLTRADADVAGRHVQVGADVAVQLAHERLAETHHLGVALALRIEVGAALAAAHGQSGQEFLKTCSKARNFSTPRLTEGWKRRPPL